MRSLLNNRKLQRNVSRLIRGRRAFMRLKSPGLVLDVGCGPNPRPVNLNLDFHWRPGVDICCDITRALPLDDGYVGGVFSEHCLEHIPFKAALAVLAEFHRVMQPGAYARIIVPDFELYVDQYIRFRNTGQASMPYADDDPIGGIYTLDVRCSINRIFRGHGHQFIYAISPLFPQCSARPVSSISAGADSATAATSACCSTRPTGRSNRCMSRPEKHLRRPG